jgi:hypothetical protein
VNENADEGGLAQGAGEAVGSVLSGVPGVIGDFFRGLGDGAGIHGVFDWTLLVIAIALFFSVYRGVKRGRVIGPVVSALIAFALLGGAIA